MTGNLRNENPLTRHVTRYVSSTLKENSFEKNCSSNRRTQLHEVQQS